MKKNKKVTIFMIIFVASLLPVSPNNIFNKIFSQAKVDKGGNITGTEVWDQDKTIDKDYTVKAGAELIIKKGVTIDFSQGDIIVDGKLLIEGTLDEPVKIEKSLGGQGGYTIAAVNVGEIDVRNADVSGGGRQACLMMNDPMVNTTYACNITGAVSSQSGTVRAENVSFHDNVVAVSVAGQYPTGSSGNVKVNRSEFLNNSLYDVSVSALNSNSDFKYNWWGDDSGPSQQCDIGYDSQQYCYYDKTKGDFDFSNWRTQEKFHDPVIIVPGILGSWKWTDKGDWQMDPIFKTYDSLQKTFEENGYQEGKDLFTLPYQWRASNADTAKLLQEKIREITQNHTVWPKVDILAHSMGGLVVRQYIESADYQDDIDQVVLLGTPNKGAPEDYLVWESGGLPPSNSAILDWALGLIVSQEAHEAGFQNTFDYLHNEPIASVQQLLPDYDYLRDASSNKLRSYSNGGAYPQNSFLDNLNSPGNISKLDAVSITNIVGKQDKNETINEIKVGKPSSDENSEWADGQPINKGLINGKGDGTVPLSSAEAVPSDEQIEINSPHMNLPGQAQDTVYKILTGDSPQTKVSYTPINNTLFFFVMSPIDIQIIAPSGKWIGKNINNLNEGDQIGGAYYSGADLSDGSKNPNEFATIPNPEDGDYTVVTEGTGSGNYTVEVAKISEDENNPGQATQVSADITGTAIDGDVETASAIVSGDSVTTGSNDNTPPEITAD
ncbi:MAG: hypothetical protein P4L58_00535, partial [Candidatus Pacebacteria bacterium]|nr:hypothetical protein [Candidatus Paceibacterota bacterium]